MRANALLLVLLLLLKYRYGIVAVYFDTCLFCSVLLSYFDSLKTEYVPLMRSYKGRIHSRLATMRVSTKCSISQHNVLLFVLIFIIVCLLSSFARCTTRKQCDTTSRTPPATARERAPVVHALSRLVHTAFFLLLLFFARFRQSTPPCATPHPPNLPPAASLWRTVRERVTG